MIKTSVTKGVATPDAQEKLFKLLEGIDWKLWEMYNMMKDNLPQKEKTTAKPGAKKAAEE